MRTGECASRGRRGVAARVPLGGLLLSLGLVLSAYAEAAEVAVIPYRVEDPSRYFPEGTGEEYAKLLGVALAARKNLEVYSPRDLERDLAGFAVSPRGVITREQLDALGKGRYIDLILVGTLERAGGSFVAEGSLYSVSQGRVMSRARVRGDTLFQCAEREIGEVFIHHADAPRSGAKGAPVETAFVFDLSYGVSREWGALRAGIVRYADTATDGWETPARVYLVPFSDAHSPAKAPAAFLSPAALRAGLEKLSPRGGNNGTALGRALEYAVRNIPWRREADKAMVLVSNSPLGKAGFAERYALAARQKRIALHSVALGMIGRDDAGILRELAVTGNGRPLAVAYHQRVYDLTGGAIDLYMEGGRLFRGASAMPWRDGLYGTRSGSGRHEQPKTFLSEVFYDESKYGLNPYNMGSLFPEVAGVALVNRDPVENNADAVLEGLGGRGAGKDRTGKRRPAAGKALLAEGGISLWARVEKPGDMEFFARQERLGYSFTLGVTVQKKADEPYGFTFGPGSYVTGLSREHLPGMVRATLKDIVARPDYYTDNGLFRPPLWFIDVKVEKSESSGAVPDIRDER